MAGAPQPPGRVAPGATRRPAACAASAALTAVCGAYRVKHRARRGPAGGHAARAAPASGRDPVGAGDGLGDRAAGRVGGAGPQGHPRPGGALNAAV